MGLLSTTRNYLIRKIETPAAPARVRSGAAARWWTIWENARLGSVRHLLLHRQLLLLLQTPQTFCAGLPIKNRNNSAPARWLTIRGSARLGSVRHLLLGRQQIMQRQPPKTLLPPLTVKVRKTSVFLLELKGLHARLHPLSSTCSASNAWYCCAVCCWMERTSCSSRRWRAR